MPMGIWLRVSSQFPEGCLPCNLYHFFGQVAGHLQPTLGTCMTKCRRPRNCFRYFVLFSLFGSIWILTVFAILHRFDTEKTNQRKLWASPNASKNIYFWNLLEVLLFSLICLFSVKTVQNSENSQYPNASKQRKQSVSKCFQMLPNSENSFLVSGILSYC